MVGVEYMERIKGREGNDGNMQFISKNKNIIEIV